MPSSGAPLTSFASEMENSEFSFKKSPTALLRIDSKLDNFSFKKKNESPIHLQKIAENVSG